MTKEKNAPFFVRFLANQEEMKNVKGGKYVTMKYPSDNDEQVDI